MKQEREMMLQRLGVKKSKKNESQGKGSVAKLNSPSKTPNSTKSKNILDSKGKMKKKRSKMKTGGGFTVSDLEWIVIIYNLFYSYVTYYCVNTLLFVWGLCVTIVTCKKYFYVTMYKTKK